MKNVSERQKKTCIFVRAWEYEDLVKSLFVDEGNVSVTFYEDGVSHELNDDSIDTSVLYSRLAEYFDVETVTSVHLDNCLELGVWICYQAQRPVIRLYAENIEWDADDEEDIQAFPTSYLLPESVTMDKILNDEFDVADYLSDQSGFMVRNFIIREAAV